MARRNFIKVTNNLGQPNLGFNGAANLINGCGVGALPFERNFCCPHCDERCRRKSSTSALRCRSNAVIQLPSNRALEKLRKGKKRMEYGFQVGWLANSNVRRMCSSLHEGKKKSECALHTKNAKSSSGKKYYKYLCRESKSQLKQQESVENSKEPPQNSWTQNVRTAPYEAPKFTAQFLEMFQKRERSDFLVSITDPTPPSMQRWAVEWNSEPKRTISVSELKEDLLRETGGKLGKDTIKAQNEWISVQNPLGPSSITTPLRKLDQNRQSQMDPQEQERTKNSVHQEQSVSNKKYKTNCTPNDLYSFKKFIENEMSSIHKEKSLRSSKVKEKKENTNQGKEGPFKTSNVHHLHTTKQQLNQLSQCRQRRGWASQNEENNNQIKDDPLVSGCSENEFEEKTTLENTGSLIEGKSSFNHWLQQRGFVPEWLPKRKKTYDAENEAEETGKDDEQQFPWSVSYSLKGSVSGSTLPSTGEMKNELEEIPVRKSKTEIKLSSDKQNKSHEFHQQQKQDSTSQVVHRHSQLAENSCDLPIRKWEVIDESDHVQNIRAGDRNQTIWTWTKPASNKKAVKAELTNKKHSLPDEKRTRAIYEDLTEFEKNVDDLFGDKGATQKKKSHRKKSTYNFQKYQNKVSNDKSSSHKDRNYYEDEKGEFTYFDENVSQMDLDWYKTIGSKNHFSRHTPM